MEFTFFFKKCIIINHKFLKIKLNDNGKSTFSYLLYTYD